MKKNRYTEEQIAYALKQAEMGTAVVTSRILRTFVGTQAPSSSFHIMFSDYPSRSTIRGIKQQPLY